MFFFLDVGFCIKKLQTVESIRCSDESFGLTHSIEMCLILKRVGTSLTP